MRNDTDEQPDLDDPAPRTRPRRRRLGIGLLVASVVLSIATVAGAVATFTDVADHGLNSFGTNTRAKPVDLRLNLRKTTADNTCPGMQDNVIGTAMSTGGPLLDDSSYLSPVTWFCVENIGTVRADVTLRVINVTDTDGGCTGAENIVDTTCGGDQAGELADAVGVELVIVPIAQCSGGIVGGTRYSLADLASTGVQFPLGSSSQPDFRKCVGYRLQRIGGELEAQAAQSDRLTFGFRLEARDTLPPIITVPTTPEL